MQRRPPDDPAIAVSPAPGADDQLVVALTKLGLVLRHHARTSAAARGLNPTQEQILACLLARRAPCTMGELAQSLGVTAPTASDSVSALEGRALVRRREDHADARRVLVELTPRGRREASREPRWPDGILAGLSHLSGDERAVLARSFAKVIRALQDRGEIPVQRMCVECAHFRPNAHASRGKPHHCALVDSAFGDSSLRFDCADHEPAEPAARGRAWQVFVERRVIGAGSSPG